MRPFVLNVADLLHRPGSRRHERLREPIGPIGVGASAVPAGGQVDIDALFEWVTDGLLASGSVAADWQADCQRCLRPAEGRIDIGFRELFERQPREGESYQLGKDSIDMEPLVREALLLELPLVPLCSTECAGLCPGCGTDLNEGGCECESPPTDPRWAALDALRVDALRLDAEGGAGNS